MSYASSTPANHVLPLKVYLLVAAALLVLTVITVLVARFDFGGWNVVIALGIAATKGSLVVLYFMHLRYDLHLFGFIFVLGVIFVALFISFTMFDTSRRADIYEQRGLHITEYARIYDNAGKPIPMGDRQFQQAEARAAGEPERDTIPFEIRHGFGPIKEVVEVGPLDTALALRGEKMFESKCATCHKLDERYTGPPLRGVTNYRSATFIMNQILDPAQNVAKHPDMQAMLRSYYTIMTNQNVTREDARALFEYLRLESDRGRPQQADKSGT